MATATNKKKRLPLLTSEQGTLQFPKLLVADTYEGKSSYSTTLVVPVPDAQTMVEKIITRFEEIAPDYIDSPPKVDKIRRRLLAGGGDGAPWGPALDRDKNAIPGFGAFKFRVPESYTSKKTGNTVSNRPVFFDRHGAIIPTGEVPEFGFGSIVRINFDVFPYDGFGGGVNLRPREVQLIKILTGSHAPTGFGAVESDDEPELKSGGTLTDTDDEIPF